MISVFPSTRVAVDGSALIQLSGIPFRAVLWALDGPGTLTVISAFTDASGVALARYTPGSVGDTPIVSVTYVA